MTKAIPISNFDFAHLIEKKMNYVDKTDYLHRLVVSDNNCFFLSRPRRFGKSLMISTLKYIFEGRRDLFAGLKMDSLAYDWQEYPVVHINMADMKGDTVQDITTNLEERLHHIAKGAAVLLPKKGNPTLLFRNLLEGCAAQSPTGKVVLLIDEYDAPMVNNIGEPHFEAVRKQMGNFYEQIKHANLILRFTMMTGVTRFPKVSIFSALNHMTDISMDSSYATMLGYTQPELEHYFGERMEELAQIRGIDVDSLKKRIKVWYNGYRFHPLATTLYNPVSIGTFLNQNEFDNWWFDTGSPSLLLSELKKKPINYFDLLHKPVGRELINTFNPSRLDARSLLFQTGYLTIVDAEEDEDLGWFYTLGFPNKEVELSLSTHLVLELGAGEMTDPLYSARTLAQLIRRGETVEIVEAMAQIHKKGYYEQFRNQGKQIHLVALNYDPTTRNIGDDWMEELM